LKLQGNEKRLTSLQSKLKAHREEEKKEDDFLEEEESKTKVNWNECLTIKEILTIFFVVEKRKEKNNIAKQFCQQEACLC
jgi:hypothetical protein